MDIKQASLRWGISDRRIRVLCNEGRIDGAIKTGWSWMIPLDAEKPRDGRTLRHFKNLEIRAGSVDVDNILRKSILFPVKDELKSDKRYHAIILSSLLFLLEKENIILDEKDVKSILKKKVVPSLSLEIHLVVSNFASIMISLVSDKEELSEKKIKAINKALLQGIDDITSSFYRNGFSEYEVRGKEKLKVDAQMETLFYQAESWKALNALSRSVMIYGELERIRPFDRYSSLLSFLVLSSELLKNNILPPTFLPGDEEEMRNAYFIALKRGNYRDFTSFIEKRVNLSYR